MDSDPKFTAASIQTAQELRTVASLPEVTTVSQLSLPEIEAISNLVARVMPAGNVPGVILSGLARLPGRKVPLESVRRDIRLLFKGVEETLDQALYATLFAGPAAVLWGYQMLLKLAGKTSEAAFPEGTWQFYVDYALREDSARHTNETHGFDSALKQHNLSISPADRLTAWVLAAVHTLYQYEDLIENEWREHVYCAILDSLDPTLSEMHLGEAAVRPSLHRQWQAHIPYHRAAPAVYQTYPQFRRSLFDAFIQEYLTRQPAGVVSEWHRQVQTAEVEDLPSYQRQMSILAYLEPERYNEVRTRFAFSEASIGLVVHGHYYCLPAADPATGKPVEARRMRQMVQAILDSAPVIAPASLAPLAEARRSALAELRPRLSRELHKELEKLRKAPILINADARPRRLPLSQLRQAERGSGDHPLTLFDTGESWVFDQSHIFFDGVWGAALGEIMTNEALSWAVYLHGTPPGGTGPLAANPPAPLRLRLHASDRTLLSRAPRRAAEAGAENRQLNLGAIQSLRHLLKQRNRLIQLTVNDLLVLYRAIHGCTYRPDPGLVNDLKSLESSGTDLAREAAEAARHAVEEGGQTNPALLIPVAANPRLPRERLYPLSFEVPLEELDLLELHTRTLAALEAYQSSRRTASLVAEAGPDGTNSEGSFSGFDALQRTYLATLAGMGALLSRAKAIALSGETTSVGAIKLLAHLPVPIQRLLDRMPATFDLLNDVLKGREVFSNIGAVAPTSTLTRFLSAKDDNEKKTLIWGVMTDNTGTPCITLRDFRPHVAALQAVGREDLAQRMAQDYLDSYVSGMNAYIADLRRMTIASRKTRRHTPGIIHAD